jgi:3'-phosphoadenosine 5'-phosphosulfate sulfotransferase (PAPS reductase)/FAD synthetase
VATATTNIFLTILSTRGAIVEKWQLTQRQGNPLPVKVQMSLIRIREWYEQWGGAVYVAYSGGKDSVVLLHLVRSIYPCVPAVFVNTRVEFPEIVRLCRNTSNCTIIRPRMTFRQVLDKYGYPVVSKEQSQYIHEVRTTKSAELRHKRLYGVPGSAFGKISNKWQYLINAPFKVSHYCCDALKKRPAHLYNKAFDSKPFIGVKASDSRMREGDYLRHGCNTISKTNPHSRPLAFWTDSDVWGYIQDNDLPVCSVYGKGYRTTGCIFCMFGIHREQSPNRFQLLAKTHPKLWEYGMYTLGFAEVCKYMSIPYMPEITLF